MNCGGLRIASQFAPHQSGLAFVIVTSSLNLACLALFELIEESDDVVGWIVDILCYAALDRVCDPRGRYAGKGDWKASGRAEELTALLAVGVSFGVDDDDVTLGHMR